MPTGGAVSTSARSTWPSAVRITITGADVRTTRDRRSDEIVALPSAVAEIRADGADAVPIPTEVELGCHEVLTIDGVPASFDLGTVRIGAVLAGEPIVAHPCPLHGGDIAAGAELDTIRIESRPGVETGLDVDRIVLVDLAMREPAAGGDVGVDVLDQERTSRTVRVAPCPTGCWVVLGEGLNDGWVADDRRRQISAPGSSSTAASTAGACPPRALPAR